MGPGRIFHDRGKGAVEVKKKGDRSLPVNVDEGIGFEIVVGTNVASPGG